MNSVIYIYNLDQAYFYIENKIRPIEKPRVHKTTGKIFFCFDREESKEVYEKWVNKE